MAASDIPEDLLYHPEHTWARIEGDTATFGITDHAQDLLGEIVFWNAPQVGSIVKAGEAYTELESMKAVSDVFAPLSGDITTVNDAACETPETINDDAYGDGWLVKIKLSDPSEADALLSPAKYAGELSR